jgi:hypothetical protein
MADAVEVSSSRRVRRVAATLLPTSVTRFVTEKVELLLDETVYLIVGKQIDFIVSRSDDDVLVERNALVDSTDIRNLCRWRNKWPNFELRRPLRYR